MPDWVKIAALVLKISIITQVFAVGLSSNWYDATFLFRHPRLLWNSILARNIIVPAIAIGLIQVFSLHTAVMIAFCVLAVTPVPPLVPKGQLQAGGPSEYILGLLVSQAVLAIVFVPLTIEVMDWIMGARAHFGPARVGMLVFQTILLPLATGMVVARVWPAVRSAAAHILRAGTVLLIAGGVPLLFLAWKTLGVIAGNGTLVAMAIFVIAATAVGHFLGGPAASDRTVLAEATSSRHPGMAVAIALVNFPEQGGLVAGAIVTYRLFASSFRFPIRASGARPPTSRPHTVTEEHTDRVTASRLFTPPGVWDKAEYLLQNQRGRKISNCKCLIESNVQ